MLWTIITTVILGAIVGGLARLVMPGKQNISMVMTILLGALGALAGSWIFTAISGKSDTKGIDWIALILGVVCAAVFIGAYLSLTGRKNTNV